MESGSEAESSGSLPGDVGEWLQALGLACYAERFAAHAIDPDVLADLTDADLERLGVLLGHRKKLLKAIARLRPGVSPATVPGPYPRGEAERRQLTVMFCDLVGSTALSQALDPEDLSAIIGRYQAACAAVVSRMDGQIAAYLGDGILAYFGFPRAHEDDADRAVRAGLEIVAAVGRLKQSELQGRLDVRVGIATGLVVVGDVGGEGRETGVVGETPNLAARLQSLAEPNTVVIGPDTHRLLGDAYRCANLGAHPLKGFARPVQIWRVLEPRQISTRFAARHVTGRARLVGRDEELGLLLERWRRAAAGEGQVVLLSGEPGIGKSHLAEALCEQLAPGLHLRLRLQCLPYYANSAFYPVMDYVARAAGFAQQDSPEVRFSKLQTLMAQSAGETSSIVPVLAAMLSLPLGESHPEDAPFAQHRRERMVQALADQMLALARRTPVLLIFEDAHWCDPSTLESLARTVKSARQGRLMVVVTYRPDFRPPWSGEPHVSALTLQRLDRQHSAALIADVGGTSVPEVLQAQILDKAEGIPLFVEELTKAVLETGLLDGAAAEPSLEPSPAALAIPATLRDSLMARLDRLAPVKEVAQICAVLGRQFARDLLAAVSPVPEPELEKALTQLEQAGLLLREREASGPVYRFKHALLQEAAYESILRSRRQQLHARIAAAPKARNARTAETEPELLAYHLAAAGMTEEAVRQWLAAGELALRRLAAREAVNHLGTGLRLLSRTPDSTEKAQHELCFQAALGQAWMLAEGYAAPQVEAAYRRAYALCVALDDSAQTAQVLVGLVVHHWTRGQLREAQDTAEKALDYASRTANEELRVIAEALLGGVLWHAGDNRGASQRLHAALALYQGLGKQRLSPLLGHDTQLLVLGYAAHAAWCLGDRRRAERMAQDVMAAARGLGQPASLLQALGAYTTACAVWESPPCTLREAAEESLALCNEQRLPYRRSASLILLGWARVREGAVEKGIGQIRDGLTERLATGANLMLALYYALLAQAELAAGRPDLADAAAAEADAWIAKTGEEQWKSMVLCVRGDVLCARGDAAGAEAAYRAAIDTAASQAAPSWQLRAAVRLAALLHRQDRGAAARDLLSAVYASVCRGAAGPDLHQAAELLRQLA